MDYLWFPRVTGIVLVARWTFEFIRVSRRYPPDWVAPPAQTWPFRFARNGYLVWLAFWIGVLAVSVAVTFLI